MGNCISWDRNKSIWALRILSEVLLCTGIVSCVAAFTIEQGKPNIYLLVLGLCLFLFAAIGLASSFCLSHEGKAEKKNPVYTVTLPPAGPGSFYHPTNLSVITNNKNKMFASMKSIPVDSLATEVVQKHHKPKKYHRSDKMSSITEKGQIESTSDEGFNSGAQTTNSSPDVSQKKQRRRKQRRRENKKDGTESRSTSQSRTSKSSKSSDEYLTRI